MAGNAALFGPEGWQYSNYSTVAERTSRSASVLQDLIAGNIAAQSSARDTRPIHGRLFTGMHPAGFGHLAGQYRGAKYPVLSTYNIKVDDDSKVGVHYSVVASHMATLAARVDEEIGKRASYSGRALSGKELLEIVGMSCSLMVKFLTIHPYADGNGHMGRFMIWALLHHFGVHAQRWPLEERPGPNYFDKIKDYRKNKRMPLIEFVLAHIIPNQGAAVVLH